MRAGELRKGPTRLKVPYQSIEVLKALLERPGELVTRGELRDRLWPPGTFVDFEHGLNAAVRRLRDALGDSADAPTLIETLPRKGYRFIGVIEPASVVPGGPPAPPPPITEQRHDRWSRSVLVIASAAVVVLATLAGYFAIRPGSPGDPGSEVPRLVVLPFENLGSPNDEYFADGMTDEITARLAGLAGLAMIARQSAMLYKGGKTPQQIGEELDVDYLLEATVSWQRGPEHRNRIRIRPQLIRTRDAIQVWADVYDEDVTEVFAVQSRIANRVVEGLGVALLEHERRAMTAAPTSNTEAHDYYLRGLQYLNQSEQLFDAREHAHRCSVVREGDRAGSEIRTRTRSPESRALESVLVRLRKVQRDGAGRVIFEWGRADLVCRAVDAAAKILRPFPRKVVPLVMSSRDIQVTGAKSSRAATVEVQTVAVKGKGWQTLVVPGIDRGAEVYR